VIRQAGHNGVITCCGNVLGHQLHTNVYPFILRGVSLMGIDSGIALMEDRLRIWKKLASDWKPNELYSLARVSRLEELPGEIRKILNGQQVGKVVVNLRG